jgi:hypothetical protein
LIGKVSRFARRPGLVRRRRHAGDAWRAGQAVLPAGIPPRNLSVSAPENPAPLDERQAARDFALRCL